MNAIQSQWMSEFAAITRSHETANRLIELITEYSQKALWTWQETAELTKRDLLRGETIEEVITRLTI